MAFIEFDTTSVEPSKSFELLPPGQYRAEITNTEIKDAKSGNGRYLKCEYTILDGEHAGRKVWSQHNILHSNPKAEQIGRGQLATICFAVGVTGKLTDTDHLCGRPLEIYVGIEKGNDVYADQNRVNGWSPTVNTNHVAPPVASAPTAPAKKAPWQKGA